MGDRNGTRGYWIGLCLSLLVIELGYRVYLYQRYALDVNFQVTTQDNPAKFTYLGTPNNIRGNYQPGLATWTRYGVDGEKFSELHLAFNNLGWRSRFDYTIEKQPGEYRIAIVGDSITASVNNERAWPDLLQDELNGDRELLARQHAKSITVLNLSTQGAFVSMLSNELTDIAKRLDADLLIVNYPIDSIARRGGPVAPAAGRVWQAGPSTPVPVQTPEIEIEGVQVSLWGCPAPRRLENAGCRMNPVWSVPKRSSLSGEDVRRLKSNLAQRLVEARIVKTVRPLMIYELMGEPVFPRTDAQAAGRTDNVAADIAFAVDAFSVIRQIYPNAMFTHPPLYWHLYPEKNAHMDRLANLTDAAREAGIDIVDMRRFLPLQGGKEEFYRWYQLPNDGHFSDYGAAVYAKAMHQAIVEHLASGQAVN